MSISRPRWRPLLIVLSVALISLPAADVVYRLAGAAPSANLSGLFWSFGDGGYRQRENISTSADWYSGPFTVLTDDLGLRCGVDPASRTGPGDTIDLLVIGDSQGFGHCVDYEGTVVGGLRALAAQQDLKVANGCIGGHYLRNQLELARWLHDKKGITARRVVVMLTPYLVATPHAYNRVRVSPEGDLFEHEPTVVSRLALWAKTNTTIFGRVRNMVNNIRGIKPDNSALLSFFATGEKYEQHAQGMHDVFGEISTWTDSIGAELIVVYTPLAVEMDFSGVDKVAAAGNISVDKDAPSRLADRVADEFDLPLIDLRPALAARLAAGKPLTCRGDPHYDRETSLVCASLIWKAVWPQLMN